ncbi:hypothetical protein K491DRAFT_484291 [Lophiostoma macrostomum CBS 122681]|uniref:Uncharacterized protein n=1 Tax=Lophiostoma macrostomum CBS 122681 TaxID=1314788 RepID=A0A6A6T4Y9_9PLEO|nr:hypothetical protein K491DRAFT_484291 [Lophiostoma macrostomum CBS 122681]
MDPVPPEDLTGTPLLFRRCVFFFMLLLSLWNFFLNLLARSKDHLFNNINGFPLWILNIVTTIAWVVCTVLYIAITWRYAREHPYWSVCTLVLAIFMTGSSIWAGLDVFDWLVWGPLVINLAIIVCAGFEATYKSAQSGMLRATWIGFWGPGGIAQPPPQPPQPPLHPQHPQAPQAPQIPQPPQVAHGGPHVGEEHEMHPLPAYNA